MEAIIKTNDRSKFHALLNFLKTFNITVETKVKKESAAKSQTSLPKENILKKLVGMYDSGVTKGSVNHDEELYRG